MGSERLTGADIPTLLRFYEAKLSLLLTISQSRSGAAHVMGAGLLHAIHVSGLFSVDPDIGVGKSGSSLPARARGIFTDKGQKSTTQTRWPNTIDCFFTSPGSSRALFSFGGRRTGKASTAVAAFFKIIGHWWWRYTSVKPRLGECPSMMLASTLRSWLICSHYL